jgi:Alpha-1,3-glucanase catalytic domain D1/Alpha-1,3-glucanase catalytic domain D2
MHSFRPMTVLLYALSVGTLPGCGRSNEDIAASSAGGSATASGGAGVVSGGGTSSTMGGAPGAGGAGAASGGGGSNTMGGAPGAGGAGSGGAPVVPPSTARGANLNYVEYEAEDGETTGMVLGPTRATAAAHDVTAESSQRKAVRLTSTGQYVRITSKSPANSIVVRYSVPDSADGQGASSTISVYVKGTFRQKLNVSSRWSWTYGTTISPSSNDPAVGNPRHYYDESHALIGDIAAGQTVTLQKDSDDTAAYYVIDLIDLELVNPPLPQPAGSLSITADCGATPDDASDDRTAIQNCINRARGTAGGLYIPQGTFNVLSKANARDSAGLNVDNVTIRGAGMWYSTLSGVFAALACTGSNCKYSDFAVFGDTVLRNDSAPDSNFSGPTGPGSSLTNIWMEHSKTGYWVGPGGNGLLIKGCRVRNLFADGVNFFGGTSNSIVEQTHLRNTGDDSLASWSPASQPGVNTNNVFRFNTVQAPWMANCVGIYGGNDNKIEDNICSDTVQYPGILIAQQFTSHPFGGTTSIQRNSLVRDGGFFSGGTNCALKFAATDAAMSGFLVNDMQISDSTYCGIQIAGANTITNLTLQNIAITASATSGLQFNSNARGSGVASGVTVSNGGLVDQSRGAFTLTRQAGNVGW